MSVYKDLYVKKDLVVGGNLNVQGTTTSFDSTNVLIADNYTVVNAKSTTVSTYEGGIAINYESLAERTDGASFSSSNTINYTAGDLGGDAGDFVLVSGSTNNDGIYEIVTPTATALVIGGNASGFANTAVANDTEAFTVALVSIAAIRSSSTGVLQYNNSTTASNFAANYKSVLLSGDSVSNAAITLTHETAPLVFDPENGTVFTTTVVAAPQSSSSAIYTIPDTAGVNAEFLLTTGGQTIDPDAVAGGALTISNTSTQSSGDLVSITGELGFTALNVAAGNVVINENLDIGAGAEATPSLTLNGDADSGIYQSAADNVDVSAGGARIVNVSSTGLTLTSGVIASTNLGTASSPAYTFVGDPNTGVFSSGANILDFAANGVNLVSLDGTEETVTLADTTVNGLFTQNIQAVSTTPFLVSAATRNILEVSAGTAITITLPDPNVAEQLGKSYLIVVVNAANPVTINPGVFTLGSNNDPIVMDTLNQSIRVTATSTGWIIG